MKAMELHNVNLPLATEQALRAANLTLAVSDLLLVTRLENTLESLTPLVFRPGHRGHCLHRRPGPRTVPLCERRNSCV
jgi:hypothetical protein